ncbi:hypothetical protein TRVL_06666 [Trypanosoma vivax]|nr:hypothetical protein TRVL_06666 [Trypanosoma vivax]
MVRFSTCGATRFVALRKLSPLPKDPTVLCFLHFCALSAPLRPFSRSVTPCLSTVRPSFPHCTCPVAGELPSRPPVFLFVGTIGNPTAVHVRASALGPRLARRPKPPCCPHPSRHDLSSVLHPLTVRGVVAALLLWLCLLALLSGRTRSQHGAGAASHCALVQGWCQVLGDVRKYDDLRWAPPCASRRRGARRSNEGTVSPCRRRIDDW